jgi:D-alanyl-D-alanine carboxypeptidase/D-alanyl-D-alanine-endopeptidase (penicillin-binding protein 4)
VPRVLLRLAAAVLVLCFSLSTASASAIDASTLQRKLAGESRLLGGAAGVRVLDLDTGRVLFSRQENLALAPASNQKLYTTASALLRFGADGVLTTAARALPGVAVDEGGSLRGDLFLVGGGDPSLTDGTLRALAVQLTADAGLRRVTGGVIGDDSRFDAVRGFDPFLGGRLGALTWAHGRGGDQGPAQLAADRLQRLLGAAGVDFGRRARAGALRPTAGSGNGVPVDLAAVDSPPMRTLVAATNMPSDNFYAETLVKALGAGFGAGGTTRAGLAVVRADLAAFGIHPRLTDGSGLSRADRTTARQLVRLLERMAAQDQVSDAWMASLAVDGRSGTLRRRGRGTASAGACRGKTGTLSGVSALSGYCAAPNGHTLAFSVIANRVFTPAAKRIEDRIVAAIARFDGA